MTFILFYFTATALSAALLAVSSPCQLPLPCKNAIVDSGGPELFPCQIRQPHCWVPSLVGCPSESLALLGPFALADALHACAVASFGQSPVGAATRTGV